MRNLALRDKKLATCSLLKECQAATLERNLLYFTTSNELCKLDVDQPNPEENVEILVPLEVVSVLDVKYLPEEDVIAIVDKSGSISVFDSNTLLIDVVGDVSGGIAACSWSLDMEILVLVSGTGNVLLMTRTWDVLQETQLFQQDFGEAKFVTVGWGSKETQFHGSEGKEARGKREIQSTLAGWDDQMTRITWRADGLFFAINAVEPNCGYRVIRVFSREGHLQSTSEPVGQLEQSLSWKSSGASGLITSTLTLVEQGKQQVAFFEKNGLRHGEFNITPGDQVVETYWNGDSTILAMLVRSSNLEEYAVQLWTMSNYQWYMKHVMRFEKSSKPLWIAWDVIETDRLHLITADGTYSSMDYRYVVTASKGLTSLDPACVAVIDNCKLKLTYLRETIIPPPMCGWEIDFPLPIHAVDFLPGDSGRFCVVTHGGSIYTFETTSANVSDSVSEPKITCKEGRNLRPSFVATLKLEDVRNYADLYDWRWANSSTFVARCIDQLFVMELSDSSIRIRETLNMEKRIGGLLVPRDRNAVILIHLINGKTLQLCLDDMKLTVQSNCPEYCVQLDVIGDQLISLAPSGRLYVNGKEILTAISSFTIHSDFLVVTSLQKHQLLCLSLAKLFSAVIPTERAVERGARIVHAVAASTAVVLQMPRGNLEAIHPRALSLSVVKSLIDKQSYAEAFDLMKKQRINLNLFYDHNPQEFLAHSVKFVQQVGGSDAANLSLFLSELQTEDFTTTMYQNYYERQTSVASKEKVKIICERLRQSMDDLDHAKYLLPILTSLIKQGMLPDALKRVQCLDGESTKDRALKYMAVLVDGEQLYKEALATYDLQLTLMVAHRSQKDPKEYLPFLNDLNVMADEYERRFAIDNTLKRYDSAVRNLCRCRPIRTEQILSYMKLHRVYAAIVEELATSSDDVKEVLQVAASLLAETLTSRDNHEEAGYLYQRVGLYQEALNSFKLCGMWNNCLALATTLEMSQADLDQLVASLVKFLRSTKKFGDAAHLAEVYLKDYQLCGQCLIDGSYFSEAWSLASKYGIKDWAETTLRNELNEAFEAMHSKLTSLEEECCKCASRLTVVRQDLLYKLEHPTLMADTDHADLYSETGSSVFSHTTSGKTSASAKNRRKHERKKLRLKEGSPFEDLAIIHHLHLLYLSVNPVLVEVGRLLRGELLLSKDWSRAKQLQMRVESLIKLMEGKKKEIWDFATTGQSSESNKSYGPSATTEMIISQVGKQKEEYFSTRYMELDSKVRNPPDAPDVSWKLDGLK